MRKVLMAAAIGGALTFSAIALGQGQKDHTDTERKEDAARHRALAAVHEGAAKCLESGKSEKACEDQLRKDCKGLGIGKYCGMKHKPH
jgi:hypothetical protein